MYIADAVYYTEIRNVVKVIIMAKNENSIGSWLKKQRETLHLDARTLGSLANIGQSQVSRIESGYSSLTLSALISLSWALNIDPREVAAGIGTPEVIKRKSAVRNKTELTNKLFSYDLEALFYKYFFHQDEQLLTFLALHFHEAYLAASKQRLVDFDDVQKQVRHAVVLGKKIPLPKRTPMNLLWGYYTEGGVLTIDDAASYLVQKRLSAGMTLEDLSKKTDLAQSIISRIEQGQTERLVLDDVIKLDAALNTNGEIFSMFWHALEFQLGISRNRFYVYGSGTSPFVWQAYPLADVFVKLARWTEIYTSLDWLKALRDEEVYENLAYLAPADSINSNSPERLSARAFDCLRLSLPHLLHGSDEKPDISGGRFVIEPSVLSLWKLIQNQVEQHPLGPDMLALLRDHVSDTDYHGMFRAVLQEVIRQDYDFRDRLTEKLKQFPPTPKPPIWVDNGKKTIES